MTPFIAITAYLFGLKPALTVALLAWAFGSICHAVDCRRDLRLRTFRDDWSRRFHRDLFATGRPNRDLHYHRA